MATISSSALTILDTTDHNQLSAYLTSNYSTVQTCTSNGTVYNPSWSNDTPLKIQLHAFYNQTEIDYNTSKYTIKWYSQDGISDRVEQQTFAGLKEIQITNNMLKDSESGMITFICRVEIDDVDYVESQITYTLAKEAYAVTFSVYAPNGTLFLNQNGEITLVTEKYYGNKVITSGATFQWYKYENTDWQPISNATDDSLVVQGSDVINIASYKCVMTYQGVDYIGIITLQDKSDPYISEIYTVGGNIFKNGIGGCAVYVVVRLNGQEVDPLAGPVSATAPSNPQHGDFWYQIDDANDRIIKKRYTTTNDNGWYVVGPTHQYTDIPQDFNYQWSLLDKYGNETSFQKTGKVIYMSCSDIKDVGTLQCNVMQKE